MCNEDVEYWAESLTHNANDLHYAYGDLRQIMIENPALAEKLGEIQTKMLHAEMNIRRLDDAVKASKSTSKKRKFFQRA